MTYPYAHFLPTWYDSGSTELYPTILFLHGAGERSTDLKRVYKHGPHKFMAKWPEFPLVIVAPQCPPGAYWEGERVLGTLNSAEQRLRIDPARIYLTGLSMGGFGTFETATKAPERFAALAPICGGGYTEKAQLISHVPIWVFHGAKDEIVPIQYSRDMVAALQQAGGNPKFTVYPESRHDSWTETYENPELYNWFLQQRLA